MAGSARTLGRPLPYLKLGRLKGKLIAIEGTDGVGRSTHIALLQQWLEVQGFPVMVTGWTRSNLMSRSIDAAKSGHALNRLTFSLLYATDFADRLENNIVPALRAGFVVLADRYVYTAMARDAVRGADPTWIRNVLGFALVPDLVCYLDIDLEHLNPRVLASGGMNYWESGMDLRLGEDLFDSFSRYQTAMLHEFDRMSKEFGFTVIDARRDIDSVQADLREAIGPVVVKRKAARAAQG
jgi:dTMP kinase